MSEDRTPARGRRTRRASFSSHRWQTLGSEPNVGRFAVSIRDRRLTPSARRGGVPDPGVDPGTLAEGAERSRHSTNSPRLVGG